MLLLQLLVSFIVPLSFSLPLWKMLGLVRARPMTRISLNKRGLFQGSYQSSYKWSFTSWNFLHLQSRTGRSTSLWKQCSNSTTTWSNIGLLQGVAYSESIYPRCPWLLRRSPTWTSPWWRPSWTNPKWRCHSHESCRKWILVHSVASFIIVKSSRS